MAARCRANPAGLTAIAVTFLVFHVVLSRLLDLNSWAQAADQFHHTVVPLLAISGWLMFGPRGLTKRSRGQAGHPVPWRTWRSP
jgi:hypothetical protein